MIAVRTLENVHYRVACYYLNKLRGAEFTYQSGHEHSALALKLFDQEWSHIKHWRDWSAANADTDNRIVSLCKDYPQAGIDLLNLRLHPQERLKWLETGVAAARRLGDTYVEMVHEYLLARAYNALASPVSAQSCAEKALMLAQRLDDPLYESKILITLGNTFSFQDEYELAQSAYEQALTLSKQLDSKLLMGAALNGLGNAAFDQSEFEHACNYYSQYLEISEVYGRPHEICLALRNLALIKHILGDMQTAIRYAQQCIELCRAVGDERQLSAVLGLLGELTVSQGKLTEALIYYQESLDLTRRTNRPSDEAQVLGSLGSLYVQLRDFPAALACFEAVLSLSEKSGFRFYRALALMMMAQVFRRMGDLQCAMLKLGEGLEIALTIKSITIRTYYLLETTLLWCDRGLSEQASPWIGFLRENAKELDAEQKAALDDLQQRLEIELGQQHFNEADQCGKTLDLDGVMETILEALGKRW